MKFETRYANHPFDSKHYDTETLRQHYLINSVFEADEIVLTYSHQDRIIAGGIMPVKGGLTLGTAKELAADYFLERRELGVINIGGAGYIVADGVRYNMNQKDGIYIGMGTKVLEFFSNDGKNPAKFYMNSCPAHRTYPTVHIPIEKANKEPNGEAITLNKRVINQYVHPNVCESCQLAMGMTELDDYSVWNTLPSHTHERRMEVYFYFNMKPDNFVVHLMGTAEETRHIIMHNEQAVISPSWSIHTGVGSASYTFIWGMCGENKTFHDMDKIGNLELR